MLVNSTSRILCKINIYITGAKVIELKMKVESAFFMCIMQCKEEAANVSPKHAAFVMHADVTLLP